MGEANYTLTANFATKEAAESAKPKLEAFLAEAGKAYRFWQDSRGFIKGTPMAPADFWQSYKAQFPAMFDYMVDAGKAGGDCNNALAGVASFGEEVSVHQRDNALLHTEMTWHFANWDGLTDWCKKHLGATQAWYVSDEFNYNY